MSLFNQNPPDLWAREAAKARRAARGNAPPADTPPQEEPKPKTATTPASSTARPAKPFSGSSALMPGPT